MAATLEMSSSMQTSTQREAEMKQTYVFDVDGTLTAPRQPIEAVFGKFFLAFAQQRSVVLVSGSDLGKLQEQLPDEILNACTAVFSCAGAERWVCSRLVSRKTHLFPAELVALCENFVAESSYPGRFGNHLEFRTGMLNVSAVGRNATVAQREEYFAWTRVRTSGRNLSRRSTPPRFPTRHRPVGRSASTSYREAGTNQSCLMSFLEKIRRRR